jgi:hypothetical protein
MRCDETSLRLDLPPWLLDRCREAADGDDRRPADDRPEEAADPRGRPLTVDDHALHGWV